MEQKPQFIKGGIFSDHRGTLSYVNDFLFEGVRRFYCIEHKSTETIRAWQGHQREPKWFYVVTGSFKIVTVRPDNWEQPGTDLPVEEFELSADQPGILFVPGGYANGLKALTPGSRLMVYSGFTVEESSNDDFRFDPDLWYDWENNKTIS